MKLPPARHGWNLTPTEAVALQRKLAGEILHAPLPRSVRYVAGGDASFSRDGKHLYAGWVVWDCAERRTVEEAVARTPVRFPYVPGLLSFREIPGLLAALRRLRTELDVFMLDGQGVAHPRRVGLASHFGWFMDRPSLGCAKSRLCGEHREPGARRGASVALRDRGEVIGRVVRTRAGVKPIYVSVGHRITLDDAVRLTMTCCGKYRIPEPTRLAHQLVTRAKREHAERAGKA